MTTISTQPGSHWALARLAANVLAGLVLAVWAVSLLDAHYAHLVWGGSRGGSLSPQSPLLMQCFHPWSCNVQGSAALRLLLAVSVTIFMAWLARKRPRRRARARAGGE
jgi:fluoride ion exporter CrcB/FEX